MRPGFFWTAKRLEQLSKLRELLLLVSDLEDSRVLHKIQNLARDLYSSSDVKGEELSFIDWLERVALDDILSRKNN